MKTRLRILAALVAVIALTVAAAGCGKQEAGPRFSVVPDLTKLDAGMQSTISLISNAKGYIWFEDATGGYLCVSYGNGSLTTPEVKAVALEKQVLSVAASEKPVAGGAASSVSKLTVVRIEGVKNVTPAVTDAKGDAMVWLIPASGTYNGQIDGHSVEISTQGGTLAFEIGAASSFFDSASPEYRNFQAKDQVRFCYYDRAPQRIIMYIEKIK